MITLQSAEPILEPTLFRLLPEAKKNTASLVTSCILNCALIAFLLIVGTVAHHEIQLKKMETTEIYFPVTPPPKIKVRAPKRPAPMEPKIAKLEAPKIKIPRIEPKPEIKIPVVKEQIVLQKMAAPSVVLAPQPKVALAAAPALTPQVKPSVTPVHFGDLNGVMPNPNANRPAVIAALGNPYGGAQGGAGTPRGVVGSAGLGYGTQTGSNYGGRRNGSGSGDRGKVAAAGLPGIASAGLSSLSTHESFKTTPPVLISRQQPEYTTEARQLKIEGDVVLRVTITTRGEMLVQTIIRGLGHGLDEAAVRSAPTYKFQPATKDGQPVEFTTNIIIKFQTA
jgi:TonB family protein